MRSKGRETFAAVVVSMFAVATMGLANTTNTVPWTTDFEGYADGATVIGSDGWYGPDTDAAVVAISGSDKILAITADVTNMVSSTAGDIVYVDTMIDARPWDQDTAPTVPADAQTAAYVNTNGQLVVLATGGWKVLESTSLTTGQWFRLTFKMDYANFNGILLTYAFSVMIDGTEVTDDDGFQEDGTANGPLFKMANTDDQEISSVSFAGTSSIDDFGYSNTDPNPADTETDQGVPYAWYTLYQLSTNDYADSDSDGRDEWEEYAAGTDPTNAASRFELLDIVYAGDSNAVIYYATDGGGVVTDPITVFRTTDLNGGWADQSAGVARAANGTNTWWDENLPAGDAPVFYKPVIIWNN